MALVISEQGGYCICPMSQSLRQETLEQVYQFLCQHQRDRGFAPSVREIAEHCFVGRSSAARYLDRLEAQGWIQREENTARSIRLLKRELCPVSE